MTSRYLIIPIETKARELYGKTLLAALTAEAGFTVIAGDQRVIARSLHRMPSGIYLDKSISRTKTAHYRRLRDLGFSIAAWCEEGLVYRDKEAYQFERISPASMALVDAFFAWGDVHRDDVVEVVPDAADRVHAHGNPRFDLLREPLRTIFETEARDLKARLGPYILIITTFSRYNKYEGRDDVVDVLRARGFELTTEQKAHYRQLIEHLGSVFEAFAAMIPRLAEAFPGHRIVVRPHPSENHDRWREILAGVENVSVIYEGSVEPWIYGADAVIHNASTTGIEAFLMGRPIISYMPVVDETFNRLDHLPNALSEIPHTVADAIARVRAIQEKGISAATDIERKRHMAERFVANAAGRLASERIVETFTTLAQERAETGAAGRRHRRARLVYGARQAAARLRDRMRSRTPLADYMDQKFPGLALEEVQAVLDHIGQARPLATTLKVEPFAGIRSCFVIRSG